jgi:hypothetical protein
MRIEITAHVRDGFMPASRQPSSAKEGFFMPHVQARRADHAQADFRLTYHGTISTITPLTDAAREWLEANVEIDPWQRFGPSIALEPRYVEYVAEAMTAEGLVIEDEDF